MPSPSKAQRRLMAIAEHHPEQVKAKNRGVLKMSHKELHDFASTREKGLPEHVAKRKPARRAAAPKKSAARRSKPKGNFWG